MVTGKIDRGLILVVDDETVNRILLSRQLEADGHSVATAEDGREAIALLRAQPFDLVMLDIVMPEMDGHQVLAALKSDEALRYIPVIVLSALEGMESAIRCIEMGAEDYLPKPFDLVLLRARIAACLEKKRLHDQEVAQRRTIEMQATELAEWNHTLEERVRRQVEQLERLGQLQRFLGSHIAEVILSSGSESRLESHRSEIAVVFTDLRGFTAFVEATSPESMAAVLREYHEEMGKIIFRFQGTLGNFAGDGLMIFFNDPLPCPDPAGLAVQTAVAMRARMLELIPRWRQYGPGLGFGVGIAYGQATVGKIGFEGRFDYQPNGSIVNLAARLSAQALHGQILISQPVYAAVKDWAAAELAGDFSLKGFQNPVPAFNVLSMSERGPEMQDTPKTRGQAGAASRDLRAPTRLVVFRVEDREYALPLENVVEVLPAVAITPMPGAPAWISGVINLRGRVIPTMNLRVRLGWPSRPPSLDTPIIVAEANGRTMSLVVDAVTAVLSLPPAATEPVAAVDSPDTQGGSVQPVLAIAPVADRMILILDLQRLWAGCEMLAAVG